LLSAASQDRYRGIYEIALRTGMRGGEILALQPQDYDAAAGTLSIRRTLIMNGASFGTPKSKNSRRTIQLPNLARDALDWHLSESNGGDWVFPGRTGQNLRYHSFITFQWKPLVECAGIEYKSFHTCRHYVASELLARGVPVTAVARYIGDTETTLLSTYSHLIRGMEHLVPTAMDNMLADRDTRHLKAL
jgi:integrase